jgi:basic membrane protein A
MAAIGMIGGLALVAAACGEAPDAKDSVEKDFKGCMVTDLGGIDDRSFNTSAWKGMNAAVEEQPAIEVEYKKSESNKDYEPNLKAFIKDDCDVIVAVGGLMYDATKKIAEENKDQRFAIIDANLSDAKNGNVFSMEFNAAEPSFLAGYLAAASSKNEKVATFGGDKIAPVTIFMDGFVQGVNYYNDEKKKDVKVLGWNPKTQEGSFTGDFQDTEEGKKQTENFVSQGADIIFPVAGQAGLGAPAVTKDDDKLSTIWVDIDGCESAKEYCEEFLTTSEKNIAAAVKQALLDARDGGEKSGRSVGTLDNEGVSLADYRDDVPQELQDEIEAIKEKIVSGEIKIESEAQPAPEEG